MFFIVFRSHKIQLVISPDHVHLTSAISISIYPSLISLIYMLYTGRCCLMPCNNNNNNKKKIILHSTVESKDTEVLYIISTSYTHVFQFVV